MTTANKSKALEANDATAVRLDTRGLRAAERFLERQGCTILERGWESKSGSVDLIVYDEDALVFVEVKTRSNEDCGLPEEDITKDKRAELEKIAIDYLSVSDVVDVTIRFDVISILVVSEDRAFLRHHVSVLSIGE